MTLGLERTQYSQNFPNVNKGNGVSPHNFFKMLNCYYCNKVTKTIPPLVFRRIKDETFHIRGTCEKCYKMKAKFFTEEQIKQLPKMILETCVPYLSLSYIEDRTGKIHEIFPLIDKIIN